MCLCLFLVWEHQHQLGRRCSPTLARRPILRDGGRRCRLVYMLGKCSALRNFAGFPNILRAYGAARAALPPLRESVPGLTGWTPYPVLGPRGPSPRGPSLRSGNGLCRGALTMFERPPYGRLPLQRPLPDRGRGRGTVVPPRTGRRWGASHLPVCPVRGSPQRAQSGVGAGLRLRPRGLRRPAGADRPDGRSKASLDIALNARAWRD